MEINEIWAPDTRLDLLEFIELEGATCMPEALYSKIKMPERMKEEQSKHVQREEKFSLVGCWVRALTEVPALRLSLGCGSDPPQSQRQSITQARTECQDPQGTARLTGHGTRKGGTHKTMMEVEVGARLCKVVDWT